MTVLDLDKLEIWRKALDFSVCIAREVIPCLPASERWNLSDQLRRAAQSVPANIAEGHRRYHFLDNVRFCYMARGSLTEVQSYLALALRLGYLSSELHSRVTRDAEVVCQQSNVYIAYLRRSKHGADWSPAGMRIRDEPQA